MRTNVKDDKTLTEWLKSAREVTEAHYISPPPEFDQAWRVTKLIPELRRYRRLYHGLLQRIERRGG